MRTGPIGRNSLRSLLGAVLVFLLPLIIIPAAFAISEFFNGKCVAVHDGDTIGVMHNSREEKIRIYGIDCPELHQDFGSRARQFTSDLVFGKTVTVDVKGHDRYGRTVGGVKVDDKDLSMELAKAGMAWYYKKYANDPELAKAEEEARGKKLGLWSQPNPVPPWDFRRNKSNTGEIQAPAKPKSISKAIPSEFPKVDTIDTPHAYRAIYTGANGGRYYINKKGNKVYINHK